MFWSAKKEQQPQATTEQATEQEPALVSGAANPYNIAQLHPMAQLGSPIEFLELPSNSRRSEGLIASRGWSEDMSYGVGAMYLMGLASGGTFGFLEAMRTTNENMPTKLRINAILNSVTRRGPYIGNNAAIVTMLYNINGFFVDLAAGKNSDAGSVAAGAVTGALYRINAGVRGVGIASAFGAGVAGVWCVVKRLAQPEEDEF